MTAVELEPAIDEFGLDGFRMIDPACGSGHFLLGSFGRLLAHWRQRAPQEGDRALAERALQSIHGVDLNPFAAAIARFRLLVAALRAAGIHALAEAPRFTINIAVGDALLHGPPPGQQTLAEVEASDPAVATSSPPRTPTQSTKCSRVATTQWWPTRPI